MNGLKGYNEPVMTACTPPPPQETIYNALCELRNATYENREVAQSIKSKLYNPMPCNGENPAEKNMETVESLIDQIRDIVRESNSTLNTINNRL